MIRKKRLSQSRNKSGYPLFGTIIFVSPISLHFHRHSSTPFHLSVPSLQLFTHVYFLLLPYLQHLTSSFFYFYHHIFLFIIISIIFHYFSLPLSHSPPHTSLSVTIPFTIISPFTIHHQRLSSFSVPSPSSPSS